MKTLNFISKENNEALHIQDNQVHLWYIPYNSQNILSTKFDKDEVLSEDEIRRANKYKFHIHRKQFITYRIALRKILSIYYKISPRELVFKYTEYGKPYVANSPIQYNIQFNLSHSEDMAVLGVTKNNLLGVDIEYIKPIDNIDDIAIQFFSKSEYKKFVSLPSKYKLECFYEIWTRKEAFIKAIGEGLSHPLDTFEVSFYDDTTPRLIHINGTVADAKEWLYRCLTFTHERKKYELAILVNNTQSDFIKVEGLKNVCSCD